MTRMQSATDSGSRRVRKGERRQMRCTFLMPDRLGLRQLTALLCVWMVVAASPVAAEDAWYRVQDGDSFASIAEDFGVTAAAIIEYNGLAGQSTIVRGQILRIPLPDTTSSA